jgi:hypothetical protein
MVLFSMRYGSDAVPDPVQPPDAFNATRSASLFTMIGPDAAGAALQVGESNATTAVNSKAAINRAPGNLDLMTNTPCEIWNEGLERSVRDHGSKMGITSSVFSQPVWNRTNDNDPTLLLDPKMSTYENRYGIMSCTNGLHDSRRK